MNDRNTTILEREMSTQLLVDYIKEESENNLISKTEPARPTVPSRFLYTNRFPISLWETASLFFSKRLKDQS